jgi:hypothetical protein
MVAFLLWYWLLLLPLLLLLLRLWLLLPLLQGFLLLLLQLATSAGVDGALLQLLRKFCELRMPLRYRMPNCSSCRAVNTPTVLTCQLRVAVLWTVLLVAMFATTMLSEAC